MTDDDHNRPSRIENVERHQDRLDERLKHVESVVDRTSKNVETLLERDASRTQPTTWRTIAGVVVAVGASLAIIAQWVAFAVSAAPSTVEMQKAIANIKVLVEKQQRDIINRTQARHTEQDELINCLRNQIANIHNGWVCAQAAYIPQPRLAYKGIAKPADQ